MANQEQLRLLKEEGVEAWNKWRKDNPHVKIDFKEADLDGAFLPQVNLSGANLYGASLINANLYGANLRDAYLPGGDLSGYTNLSGANLSGANLSGADIHDFTNLSGANLSGAALWNTNLSSADLRGANLSGAEFKDANLSSAFLQDADFTKANFYQADLRWAKLTKANLKDAILLKADLEYADLKEANFYGADLEDANLSGTNLLGTNLIKAYLYRAKLLNANLSSAKLTGACIEDWNINNETIFENVICHYIYLKREWNDKEKEYELCKRLPADPEKNFEPGEFATLSEITFETVNLIFNNGIDWKAFLSSYQDIQVEYRDQNVSIQAIEKKSYGAFVIRLSVPPEADKADIESKVKQSYETKLKELETQYRKTLEAKDETIAAKDETIASLKYRQQGTEIDNVVKILGSLPPPTIQNIIDITNTAESKSMSDIFNNDLKGANIVNFANKLEDYARMEGKQYNYSSEQKQTLAEAAAEIQQLLDQLSKSYPTITTVEKMTVAQEATKRIEANSQLRQKLSRLLSAGKAGSIAAIDSMLDHPAASFVIAAMEDWQDSKEG